MSRRFRTPSPVRTISAPVAPMKAPELRTPTKKVNTDEQPPVISSKQPNPFPKTEASYVYETPIKEGKGFDPVCPKRPVKLHC